MIFKREYQHYMTFMGTTTEYSEGDILQVRTIKGIFQHDMINLKYNQQDMINKGDYQQDMINKGVDQ